MMDILDSGPRRRAKRRRRVSAGVNADEETEELDLGAPKGLRAGAFESESTEEPARRNIGATREKSSRSTPRSRTDSDPHTSDFERNARVFVEAAGVDEIDRPQEDPYRKLANKALSAGLVRRGDEDECEERRMQIAVADASKVLDNACVYFVNLSKKRAATLANLVSRMGGRVSRDANEEVTHVVATEKNAPLSRALEAISNEQVVLCTPEWLAACFKQSKKLSLSEEFTPKVVARALPEAPRSQSAASEEDRRLVAKRERDARASALALRRSQGVGVVWTSDLVDGEQMERRREKFSCQPGPSNEKAMPIECNTKVADLLASMAEIYGDALKDVYRAKMYDQAASALRSLNFQVTSVNECDVIPMLRKPDSKIRKYVAEILNTGRLKALEELRKRPDVRSCVELSGIHGVGPVTARKLFDQGYKSVDDLRRRAPESLLTPAQWVGLKHYEDFKKRIPREEVSYIATAVREAANTFIHDEVHCYCVGSFRRGKDTCGDIDVLVECKVESRTRDLLLHILNDLKPGSKSPRSGIIVDDLLVGDVSYMGVAALPRPPGASSDAPPPTRRRVDIKVYTSAQLPTALLYFTGSDKFNRSMRLWAKLKGFNLQDKGLFRDRDQAERSRVRVASEEDVFRALDLDYVSPDRRNV